MMRSLLVGVEGRLGFEVDNLCPFFPFIPIEFGKLLFDAVESLELFFD